MSISNRKIAKFKFVIIFKKLADRRGPPPDEISNRPETMADPTRGGPTIVGSYSGGCVRIRAYRLNLIVHITSTSVDLPHEESREHCPISPSPFPSIPLIFIISPPPPSYLSQVFSLVVLSLRWLKGPPTE